MIDGDAAKLFYHGDFYKNKTYSLNLIILKSYIDNIITKFMQISYDDLPTQKIMHEHFLGRRTLSDFIPQIDQKISDAFGHVDMGIFDETLASLKNKNFHLVKNTIMEEIHNASFIEKKHLKRKMHTLFSLQASA
ncbi:hypothetical protein ABK905_14500 [Acerihabitans sp. KWT182]|uniref:Uncharacterized protein n=1 Tax=Acerihabitans sp. KWT182 TaxID=3157919 RepID=A0AAU7Q4V7_9GAMM